MASPTAIPHPETSAHHHRGSISQSDSSSPPSAQPSASSPRGAATSVFAASRSPIYSQAHAAGRAFSLGTAGLSVSPTTPWSAGTSSGASIKDRVAPGNASSATSPAAAAAAAAALTSPVLSRAQAQKDYFPETVTTAAGARRHSRAASTSGAPTAISTADLSPSSDGPTTPRFDSPSTMPGSNPAGVPGGGMALGRVPSLPLGSSFDQLKAQRTNWGAAGGGGGGGGGTGWGGLGALRGTGRLPDDASSNAAGNTPSGRVGGLFRKFSLSSGSAAPTSTSPPAAPLAHRSHSLSVGAADSVPIPAPVPSPPVAAPASPPRGNNGALPTQTRGRRPSGSQSGGLGGPGQGGSVKRRPSPMGERLLMGHFSHH